MNWATVCCPITLLEAVRRLAVRRPRARALGEERHVLRGADGVHERVDVDLPVRVERGHARLAAVGRDDLEVDVHALAVHKEDPGVRLGEREDVDPDLAREDVLVGVLEGETKRRLARRSCDDEDGARQIRRTLCHLAVIKTVASMAL